MPAYVPLSKPLKIVWLAAVLIVAGLTLWHPPAWRSLCLDTATADGRIVATGLDHGMVRYRFESGGKTWKGTTVHHWRGGPWLDLGDTVEVFYAPSDPSINQVIRPSPGDWWRHAVGYFFFYTLFPVTLVVGMAQRFLQWVYSRTIYG